MNPRDAIVKALTPGDMFNQKGLVWRSLSTLTQFACVGVPEILDILDEHFQGLVTVRPNTTHPQRGPLVALNEYIIPVEPAPGAPQVVVMGGNAVQDAIEEAAPAPVDPAEADDLPEAPIPEDEETVIVAIVDDDETVGAEPPLPYL